MIKYNSKNYDQVFQSEAIKWWRTLSINQMKEFERKYQTFGMATLSEIANIYNLEILSKF